MNGSRLLCAVFACLVALGIVGKSYAAPVLVNGSLTGTVGENMAATGWTIHNATPDIVDQNGPFNNTGVPWTLSPDGGTFARGNGTVDPLYQESFEQTVSDFITGASYTLEFYQTNLGFLAGGSVWRDQSGYWGLYVDNVLVGQSSIVSAPLDSSDEIQWVFDSIDFTATATTQTLRLMAFSTATESGGLTGYIGIDGLDLISAVPVPAAVWLFASGMIGLAGMAGRKTA